MGYFIATLAFFVFIVYLVWFFIRLIKRKPKKQPALGMLVCFVLIVVGVMMTPSSGDSKDGRSDKPEASQNQSVHDAKKR